jgi:hypothetical protein
MDVACWIMCFPHIPRERLAKPESGGIDDIDKRMRYIRAAVATALVPEGLYTSRVRRELDDCKEQR